MGVSSNREFLAFCERLARAGLRFPLEPGARVARGFADLGHEEFLLLPGKKLVSLISGSPGELPVGHEDLFFVVPEIDQLVDELARRGWSVEGVVFEDGRSWRWRALSGKRVVEGEDRSCELALVRLALVACEVGGVQTST